MSLSAAHCSPSPELFTAALLWEESWVAYGQAIQLVTSVGEVGSAILLLQLAGHEGREDGSPAREMMYR